MSDYSKATDFAAKDALNTGDPDKIVKGAEIDTEFNNISTAVASKADRAGPALTGTTTAVNMAISGTLTASGTINFTGATVSNGGTVTTIDINGGTIDGAAIGGSTPAAGAFTTLSASGLSSLDDVEAVDVTLTGVLGTENYIKVHSNAAASSSTWRLDMYYLDSFGYQFVMERRDGGSTVLAAQIGESTGDFTLYNNLGVNGTSAFGGVVTVDAGLNEKKVALTGTTPDIDCSLGNVFTLTLAGNTTFGTANVPSSGVAYACTLVITGASTYTITWPTGTDWAGGTAPDAPAAGEVGVYTLFTHDGGTTWYGFAVGSNMS